MPMEIRETAAAETPLTQKDIEDGLTRLGLTRGMAVEVHSSLSRFGRVAGGAAAVVDALMHVVGEEGTVMMSAQPMSKPLPLSDVDRARGILAKVRILDEADDGPTGMGAIADDFRRRAGTVSGRGIHRVCAWGHQAERFCQGYAQLLEADGHVLLLGVGIDRCSSMHQAERVGFPAEVTEIFRVPDAIRKEYPADLYLAYGRTPENGWAKVLSVAESRGLIRHHRIGKAECMFFKAREVVGIYENALRTDPLGLFGIKK